jgi:hypothetical protein
MAEPDPPPGAPAQPPPLPQQFAPPPPVAGYGGPQPVLPYAVPYPNYPPYPPPPKPEDPRVRKLIFWSRVLGWGGLVMFIGGSCAGGLATRHDPTLQAVGIVIGVVGVAAAIVGGILGQIGRGMQGRVI